MSPDPPLLFGYWGHIMKGNTVLGDQQAICTCQIVCPAPLFGYWGHIMEGNTVLWGINRQLYLPDHLPCSAIWVLGECHGGQHCALGING